MRARLRPAFYAVSGSKWHDCLTLLHPPYTVWHLSYVVLGAAAAPSVQVDRLGGTVLAFFLAVGLGAHALDELRGRPLRTHVKRQALIVVAVLSIAGALALGVAAFFVISPWVIPAALFGGFIVIAYNLEWWSGRLHSGAWFAIAWGAFPALVGYWANAERITLEAGVIAGACFTLALVQRVLSRHVRDIRRHATVVLGHIEYDDRRAHEINAAYMIRAPEAALRLLTASVTLFAIGWLLVKV